MGKAKYCVFVNGDPPDFMINKFGDYGKQYLAMLAEPDKEEQWDVFRAFEGSFPTDAVLPEYDCIVLTGSKFDAYRSDAWIERLRGIVVEANDRKQRILGICFGGQLVATALGGRCAPSAMGMQMGTVECTLIGEDPLLRKLLGTSNSYCINQIHQDEIQGLPSGARLLASSAICPVEAYAIADHILCFQGHPEFSNEIMGFYLENAAERGMYPREKCEEWAATLKKLRLDTPAWHQACKRFLRQSVAS